jgi:hypothetical protein
MLRHLQEALARLATDERQRRRWEVDPTGFAAEQSLSEKELAVLRGVPLDAIERYARSLLAKRWGEVARAIPSTLRAAPSVEARYRAWAAHHPALALAVDAVLPPGPAEGLRALPALAAALARDPGEAPYAADLLRYEILAASSRADGEARTMTSAYRVDRLARDIARGLLPVDPEPEPTELRFEKRRVRWRAAR